MRGSKTNTQIFRYSKIRTFLIGCAMLSFIFYLVLVNSSATLGIEIASLQDQLLSAKEQNKKIELQIASLRSISRVEELASQLDMIAVDQYAYLTADTVFAAR
uniref:Cell division protein FtsL n=2 Tax=Candidatus Komeiliibacteriota TaxID=1817908 RepID=A0A2M7RB88_9BACT|nr:MAG: hypothetical protein COY67_03200 [Candidatus Komeilibacteria bacterium CG_4_10_14_0_8_um_filter_37_78]